MANEIEKIGEEVVHGIETAAKDVAEVVVELPKAVRALDTIIKEEQPVKADLKQFITLCEKVTGDIKTDVAEHGFNIADDEQTLADANAAFAYFRSTLLPELEKVVGEVESDVESPVANEQQGTEQS